MANGTGTNIFKLAGFIESSNAVIYSICNNSLSEDLTKFLRLLVGLQLILKLDCSGAKLFSLAPVLLLYLQKQEKNLKILNFEKKQTYEKTNGGPMKRL